MPIPNPGLPWGFTKPNPPQNPAGLNPAMLAQINTPAQVPDYTNASAAITGWSGGIVPAYGQNYVAPLAPPNYGGGYAAPAWEPPPKPNESAFWLPDGDGIHGHWVANDGSPQIQDAAYGGGVAAAAPPGTVPGVPPSFAQSYYAPSTPSPYLTLPSNWLSTIDPTMRATLNQQLQGIGFSPTGSVGAYGEQLYMNPPQFSQENLSAISDPGLRQWLKFFGGLLGYGISYNLPATYTGVGMPPSPPNPPA